MRQTVLRRVLNLIDGVLGLDEGYLWELHENAAGEMGDDVSTLHLSLTSCTHRYASSSSAT